MRFEGSFRHEYIKKDEFVDLHHYAILYSEWKELKKNKPVLFETERLILRQVVKGDAEAIQKAFNHKDIYHVTTHITHPYTLQNAKDFIRKTIIESQSGVGYYFAMILKQSGELIGECHIIHIRRKHMKCEIGFGINPNYWDRGYATEASRELIRYAFEDLKMHRIEAETMASNVASRRVLEKLGFTLDGICREQYKQRDKHVDFAHYGLLRKHHMNPN